MKLKKILFIISISLIMFISLNVNVYADMGPKPKTIINITGIEGKYVAAFASKKAYGPNFDYQFWCDNYKDSEYNYIQYNPIMEYSDEDGFKWITTYYICEGESEIGFYYYRPKEFKLIIYKDDKLYKVTDIINCYAFTSKYEINFNANNQTIKIKNTYPYFKEILLFILRLSITFAIEIGLFFLFRLYTKRNIFVVGITNIITQVLLNIILNLELYFNGSLSAIFLYILLEFLILIIEPIIYVIFTRNKNKFLVLLYGILANILSFVIGGILLTFITI